LVDVFSSTRTAGPPSVAIRVVAILPSNGEMSAAGSGVSAAVLTLALYRLGVENPALYDGSWTEWGAADGPPVATGPA